MGGSGGKSCFLGFGGGGEGGYAYGYPPVEIPPEDGENGFLLVEW